MTRRQKGKRQKWQNDTQSVNNMDLRDASASKNIKCQICIFIASLYKGRDDLKCCQWYLWEWVAVKKNSMQWYCYGGDTVATRARPWLEQMRLIQRLLSEMRMKSCAMTRKPECLSYLWGYKCSITSEALLWILCSWRSNDIQAILAICRTRVSRTQEARNWTTLFQDASHPPYSGFTRSQYGSEPTLAQSGAGVSGPRIGCLFPLAQT